MKRNILELSSDPIHMKKKSPRLCTVDGCTKWSTFGTERRKPIHCAAHKTDKERDVRSKRCTEPGCDSRPTFGTERGKPIHCAAHKTEEERDVKNERCSETGCKKQPTFGTEWMKPIHCAGHKTEDERDVMHERCADTGCLKRPVFGAEWLKPVHCVDHKTDDERDVMNAQCTEQECKSQPTFGTEWMKPIHCVAHKTDDERDVVHERCVGHAGGGCPREARAYYGKHCINCTPDITRNKIRKKTEMRCFAAIKKQLGYLVMWREQLYVDLRRTTDPSQTCAFIDAELLHANIRVLLEIDERGHAFNDSAEELARMRCVEEVLRRADPRPIAWVRFNPDDGYARASATDQRRRCHDAVSAIRELIENPRNHIVYINYV